MSKTIELIESNATTMLYPLLILCIIWAVVFIIVKSFEDYDESTLVKISAIKRFLLGLFGFSFSLIGVIFFLVWRKKRPELAKPIATGIKIYFGLMVISTIGIIAIRVL